MKVAAVAVSPRSGFASARWLAENLGAPWLRILDVRGHGPIRDDRSGPRLRVDDDDERRPPLAALAPLDRPGFVELGPRAGWLRTGRWPASDGPSSAFLKAHIPGSTSFDVGARLFGADGELVSVLELAMIMSAAGVGDEHTVVLVDDTHPSASLVAAWALRRYGHGETYILDGGFPRWAAKGLPVTREVVRHPAGSFTAKLA